jgi:aspartate/tyrosine/aromatic aminotransferase
VISYSNIFTKVPMAPPDPILGINIAYANDSDARKVNLGVGAYRDDNLKPVVFSIVRKVEEQIVADKSLNKVNVLLSRNIFPLTALLPSTQEAKN